MSEMPLDLETLRAAVDDGAHTIRYVAGLAPAGGVGDKISPPIYADGEYALEPRLVDGRKVDCVVLDSVAAQANRIELALLRAVRRSRITFPMIEVDFRGVPGLEHVGVLTSLEVPHRIADAIIRDSVDKDGVKFRETEAGRAFTDASLANAGGLFAWCPTALILGAMDSTPGSGLRRVKFARCMTSEIVGFDAVRGVHIKGRIDPLGVTLAVGTLYVAAVPGDVWTLDKAEAKRKSKKGVGAGEGEGEGEGEMTLDHKKKGAVITKKPSEIGHSSVTPTVEAKGGGVTTSRISLTTVLSLPALRKLSFPVAGVTTESVDLACRTALAALAVCGATLARAEGLDLRSRCLLVPAPPGRWEIVNEAGSVSYDLSADQACALLNAAVVAADACGVSYAAMPLKLRPMPKLVEMVRKSRGETGNDPAAEA